MNKRELVPVPVPQPPERDPCNINGRLYNQMDKLLSQLERADDEHITLKERVAALMALARIQVAFVGLRKEKIPDEHVAGSSVRKYAQAFANDARRGKAGRGAARTAVAARRPEPEPDEGLGEALSLDDDDEGDAA